MHVAIAAVLVALGAGSALPSSAPHASPDETVAKSAAAATPTQAAAAAPLPAKAASGLEGTAKVSGPGVAKAPAGALTKVVVADLRANDVPKSLARSLSEVLLSTVRDALPKVSVMGQSELVGMLQIEQQKMLLGCTDNAACLAEIGGAMGADHFVTGSIGKIGTIYLLNIKLIDTLHARVVRHVSTRIKGHEEELISAVTHLGRDVVDLTTPQGWGYLSVPQSGQVLVDGHAAGTAPLQRYGVAPGEHTVELRSAAGKKLFARSVEVSPYAEVVVTRHGVGKAVDFGMGSPAAVSTGSPWYKKWWVWTVAGVVVVGVAAGAAVAAAKGSTAGNGTVTATFTPGMTGATP